MEGRRAETLAAVDRFRELISEANQVSQQLATAWKHADVELVASAF